MSTYRITTSTGRYTGRPIYTVECMADEDHPGYGMWEPVTTVTDRGVAERIVAERGMFGGAR